MNVAMISQTDAKLRNVNRRMNSSAIVIRFHFVGIVSPRFCEDWSIHLRRTTVVEQDKGISDRVKNKEKIVRPFGLYL